MLDSLKEKINNYIRLEEEEMEYYLQFYKEKDLKKNDLLVQPGAFVKSWFFIEKGCFCLYTLKDGNEKVIEFFTEGDFFTDVYSYIQETPSNVYIKAMETASLLYINKEDVQKCYDRSHKIERFGRMSMQDAFIKSYRRIAHLNYLSNEERYLRLVQNRSELLQRVPQYLIASYLGLTPVGLSKIRKRLSLSS